MCVSDKQKGKQISESAEQGSQKRKKQYQHRKQKKKYPVSDTDFIK
jgi:hypothetical protein